MANIDRLKVSCATSALTWNVFLITGIAGSRICIAVGPRADVAASRIMTRLLSVLLVLTKVSGSDAAIF
jgi:hypothetical protein